MKKLLLLSILFNASCALAHDETAQQRVELTEKQKEIREHVFNLNSQILENELLLRHGCDITRYSQADSYDPEEYPQCAKVLEFLERYHQQIKQLNEQADQLYNAIKAFAQEQIFNDASYKKIDGFFIALPSRSGKTFMAEPLAGELKDALAENLKENGISKPE